MTSGATETTNTSFTSASNLGEGVHTLYVQERDAAGNWSASGSYATIVDTTLPAIARIVPALLTNIAKNTNIVFMVTDNVAINWDSLQVAIAGDSAVSGGVVQAGYQMSSEGSQVTISPEQEFSSGQSTSVSILVEDIVGNQKTLDFQFTTKAASVSVITSPTIIAENTILGTIEAPAQINATTTVASAGKLTLIGDSIQINAPMTIQSGGHIVFPSGLDVIQIPSQSITIVGGATYTVGSVTKTVKLGTKLVIKRVDKSDIESKISIK